MVEFRQDEAEMTGQIECPVSMVVSVDTPEWVSKVE